MVKKKRKRGGGRPKKSPEDRGVDQIGLNARPFESAILKAAKQRLQKELSDTVDVTRQMLLRLLIKKLGDQLKDQGFSIYKEYMANGNGAGPRLIRSRVSKSESRSRSIRDPSLR